MGRDVRRIGDSVRIPPRSGVEAGGPPPVPRWLGGAEAQMHADVPNRQPFSSPLIVDRFTPPWVDVDVNVDGNGNGNG